MQETSNLKNLIIAAVILVALGFASYMYLTRSKDVSTNLLIGAPANAVSVDSDLITALSSLKRLQIDTAFISDQASSLYAAWNSLFDFSQQLTPQPYGRPNPFEPFPGEVQD